MRLLAVISALGGVASRRELIKRGLSGTQLTAGVRDGVVFRVRQGHYALPDAPRDAVVAVRIGGRVGCLSALRSYGLWGGLDDEAAELLFAELARSLIIEPREGDRVNTVSAPVFDSSGQVSMQLSLQGFPADLPIDQVRALGERLRAGAHAIARQADATPARR